MCWWPSLPDCWNARCHQSDLSSDFFLLSYFRAVAISIHTTSYRVLIYSLLLFLHSRTPRSRLLQHQPAHGPRDRRYVWPSQPKSGSWTRRQRIHRYLHRPTQEPLGWMPETGGRRICHWCEGWDTCRRHRVREEVEIVLKSWRRMWGGYRWRDTWEMGSMMTLRIDGVSARGWVLDWYKKNYDRGGVTRICLRKLDWWLGYRMVMKLNTIFLEGYGSGAILLKSEDIRSNKEAFNSKCWTFFILLQFSWLSHLVTTNNALIHAFLLSAADSTAIAKPSPASWFPSLSSNSFKLFLMQPLFIVYSFPYFSLECASGRRSLSRLAKRSRANSNFIIRGWNKPPQPPDTRLASRKDSQLPHSPRVEDCISQPVHLIPPLALGLPDNLYALRPFRHPDIAIRCLVPEPVYTWCIWL